MFVLLSNDDGYLSAGLRLLADALAKTVKRVVVMAPDRDCSGASHSLTLARPLNVYAHDAQIYSVDGTPADCVKVALSGYFETLPDMVISGINRGANLGDDVIYSGTVAAAFEGMQLGLPALAVSNVSHAPKHWQSSVEVVKQLLLDIQKKLLPENTLLNVNIPDLPYEQIKGRRLTVLGRREPSNALVTVENPRGQVMYWFDVAGQAKSSSQATDFDALAQGYVSITPLQFDLTHQSKLEEMQTWLKEL